MKIMNMTIYCQSDEFMPISKIMKDNGFHINNVEIYRYENTSLPTTHKVEFLRADDKLNEFENIFDW